MTGNNSVSPASKGKQAGFLMVEVLVSMVIITVGVLGIAKLQHVAKSSNAQAVQRTIATNLAVNLIERIRANAGAIDTYFPDDNTVILQGATTTPSRICAGGTSCTPMELAQYDLWEWQQALVGAYESASGVATGGLVDPIVCMQRPAGGGDGIYRFAISWHSQSSLSFQTIAASTNASSCGADASAGAYDSTAGNDNAHRRVHWQEVFLDV